MFPDTPSARIEYLEAERDVLRERIEQLETENERLRRENSEYEALICEIETAAVAAH